MAPHVFDFAFRGQVQRPEFRLSSQVRQLEVRALHREQEASAKDPLVSVSKRFFSGMQQPHVPDQLFPPRILALDDFVRFLSARHKPVRGARVTLDGSRAILFGTKRSGTYT